MAFALRFAMKVPLELLRQPKWRPGSPISKTNNANAKWYVYIHIFRVYVFVYVYVYAYVNSIFAIAANLGSTYILI